MRYTIVLLLFFTFALQQPFYAQHKTRRKYRTKELPHNRFIDKKAKNKPSAKEARSEKKNLRKQKRAAKKQMRRSKKNLNRS